MSQGIQQGPARRLWPFHRERTPGEDYRQCPARDGPGKLCPREHRMPVPTPVGRAPGCCAGPETTPRRRDNIGTHRRCKQQGTSSGTHHRCWERPAKAHKRGAHRECPGEQDAGQPAQIRGQGKVASESASAGIQIESFRVRVPGTRGSRNTQPPRESGPGSASQLGLVTPSKR